MQKQWQRQFDFNEKFLKDAFDLDIKHLTEIQKAKLLKDYIFHLYSEVGEVTSNIKFKMHRNENKQFVNPNIVEELVDVMKFLMGCFNVLGVPYEKFIDVFDKKSDVVDIRYKQEHDLSLIDKNSPKACIDLDGVLAVFPDHLLEYMNKKANTSFSTIEAAKQKLGLERYEQIKGEYRSTGQKDFVPAKEGAKKFLDELRIRGYKIIILSARPYKKYTNIFSDTVTWFNNLGFMPDAIVFDEEKELKIIKEFKDIDFFVDDNIDNCRKVASLGYKVFHMCGQWYDPIEDIKNLKNVKTFEQILEEV